MKFQNTMEQNSTTLEQRSENQSEKSDSPIQADPSDEENKLPSDRTLTNSLVCAICKSPLFLISLIHYFIYNREKEDKNC